MKTMLGIYFVTAVMVAGASAGLWSEGFETGLGSAKTYYDPPDGMALKIGTDRPAEGKQYILAELPGKKSLEGLAVRATGLNSGRVATVTAKVRGKGELWLCLISSNGWLYSPETIALTDQWQEVSLGKVLTRSSTTLGINFLSKTVQTGAVFEVDDIRVKLATPPKVYAAEAGPWRFEAEDFTVCGSYLGDAPEASGGKMIQHERYMAMANLPFPRTGRPVTVYLRVRPVSLKEKYHIQTTRSGTTEYVGTAQPEKTGVWQWVVFAPVTADEVGNSFTLCFLGDKEAAGLAAFDQIVLSTNANLKPQQLAAAKPWAQPGPLAVVARAAVQPTLDGQGDDPCWRNAVSCTGFLGLGNLTAAKADTSVKMVYDNQNMYLLIECKEPVLEVARQILGRFVKNVADRDADVSADDSMLILLDPSDTGKRVFDFTVNALGTIADAHCGGPDLWETRDLKWNSGARAKAAIDEGVWAVEMAIPFADLGGAPQPGDTWRAGLGRVARCRNNEITTWHPARKGIHDPDPLGTLVFDGPAPGVSLETPASLQPGKNELKATLFPLKGQPRGVYLYSETGQAKYAASSNMRNRTCSFTDLGDKSLDYSPSFKLGEGEQKVRYGVVDAATLRPLYMTANLLRTVQSSRAILKLACDGPYELYLNDEVLSRGAQAKGEAIVIPLRKGANVFALRLEKGTAAVAVEAPGSNFTAETWKVSAADTKNSARAVLDDVAWPLAEKTANHPQLGPVVGEPGRDVILRRTLLWEKTRIWPTPAPAYYLARGPGQHFAVITDGLPGKQLHGWSTYIATPPEYEVVGSSGFYGTVAAQPKFQCTQLGLQQVNGREMRVARVAADKPVLSGRHYIMSLFDLFVRYREEAGEPKSTEAEFLYWNEANGGNISEPPQRIAVRLLPKLAGRQPKKLEFQLWDGWSGNMEEQDMREEVLKCMQAAGFNNLVTHDRWAAEQNAKYGVQVTLSTNFEPWAIDLGDYLKEHPQQRLISSSGEPLMQGGSAPGYNGNVMCMTLVLGDGWPAIEKALRKRMDQMRPHTVEIDYEYGPFAGPHSCYCRRCMAEFRKYAKLAPEVELNAKIIKKKFKAQWVDFMARRVARMFAKFKEAVHRISPGVKFAVYSGYQTPANPEMYGINWRYIGDLQACDKAGAGYGEPEAVIYRTVETLQGIPLLPGLLSVPYDTAITTPRTPITKARILRHLLASHGGGLLVYDRHSLDGRTWYAMAEVSRLAAAFEEVFLSGKPSAMPGMHLSEAQVISKGLTTLVCVMNAGNKPLSRKLQLPAAARTGVEFYSGKKVAAKEQIICELDGGDVAVYVMRR